MEKEINIGISNRHVHLSQEVYDLLFDEPYNILKNLKQPGEFATDKVVTLKTDKFKIDNVKVLGPCRDYTQVEIAKSDAIKFGINPPVRESGDLVGAEKITMETPKNSVEVKACIIAQRHIHISKEEASNLGLTHGEKVLVKLGNEKFGIIESFVKIKDNAVLELHIDKDDACAFLINQGDTAKIILK